MKILNGNSKNFDKNLDSLLLQRKKKVQSNSVSVSSIIKDVRKNGDKALVKYEKRFNKNTIIVPSQKQISNSIKSLDKKVKQAIDIAYNRIYKFHSLQKFKNISYTDKLKNKLQYKYLPIESVAIYVPGSTASYPSSVLMNAIPAKIAGVKNIVMACPISNIEDHALAIVAADLCGVHVILRMGGAHAIAALAYGTKFITKVDKIVGPGNIYVTLAKKAVFGDVGIDNIAGPSEVVIIADSSNNPDWIAMDLFSQAEHDELAQPILISSSMKLLNDVHKSAEKILPSMLRKDIILKSFNSRGMYIKAKNMKEIASIVNRIAPEHLEIMSKNKKDLLKLITNAGAIFLGEYTPEVFGDYCAGPNHVLPTSGSARFSSPLGVYDFQKRSSLISISRKTATALSKISVSIALSEGLQAHALAAKYRDK